MEHLDRITGYFEPKNMDTLKPEALPYVGRLMTFQALWIITEDDGGPYVGQWAMGPAYDPDEEDMEIFPFGWVPSEDIRDQ